MIKEKFLERVFARWFLFYSKEIKGVQGGVNLEQAFQHTFVGAGYEHIQPREQAEADKVALETMQKSVSELIRESGREPNDVWREIKNERETWAEMGITPAPMAAPQPPQTTPDQGQQDTEEADDTPE